MRETKTMKMNNRIQAASLLVTIVVFVLGVIGGLIMWMFAIERNTARTATATEYIKAGYEALTLEVSTTRSLAHKNGQRLDDHDRRLDDHDRKIDAVKGGP